MYTCVARNVVGRAVAAAYLQVNTAGPGPQRYLLTPDSLLLYLLSSYQCQASPGGVGGPGAGPGAGDLGTETDWGQLKHAPPTTTHA